MVRVTTEAKTGAIAGKLTASQNSKSLVTATSTTDTISSYSHETTGEFLLYAVPAGDYKISVDEVIIKENTQVVKGETTNLGEISVN